MPSAELAGRQRCERIWRHRRRFRFLPNQPIVFEAALQFTEANTNEANVDVGLIEPAMPTTSLVNSNAGPRDFLHRHDVLQEGWHERLGLPNVGRQLAIDDRHLDSRRRRECSNAYRPMRADQFDASRSAILHRRPAGRQAAVHVHDQRADATARGREKRQQHERAAQRRLRWPAYQLR